MSAEMACAYCGSPMGRRRPVATEAVCWRCWVQLYGRLARHRRSAPSWRAGPEGGRWSYIPPRLKEVPMCDPQYWHGGDDRLTELVTPASRLRVERLNDHRWWVEVGLPDGRAVYVQLWTPRARIRAYYCEDGPGDDLLEGGEFADHVICHDGHPRIHRATAENGEPEAEVTGP